MRFRKFRFRNFKGIEDLTLDLLGEQRIYPLVGLNESGKTSVLEAINYFRYRNDDLHDAQIENYAVKDIHDLIPIGKRSNFNGKIFVEAVLELDAADKVAIAGEFEKSHSIKLTEIG